jgi:hypothetical protein
VALACLEGVRMKRLVALVALTGAASMAGLALSPAQADPSVCINYDINILGQGQAGAQCLPG